MVVVRWCSFKTYGMQWIDRKKQAFPVVFMEPNRAYIDTRRFRVVLVTRQQPSRTSLQLVWNQSSILFLFNQNWLKWTGNANWRTTGCCILASRIHIWTSLLHTVHRNYYILWFFFEEIHSVVSMWHMKPSFMEDVVDLFQLNLSLSSIGSTIHSKSISSIRYCV